MSYWPEVSEKNKNNSVSICGGVHQNKEPCIDFTSSVSKVTDASLDWSCWNLVSSSYLTWPSALTSHTCHTHQMFLFYIMMATWSLIIKPFQLPKCITFLKMNYAFKMILNLLFIYNIRFYSFLLLLYYTTIQKLGVGFFMFLKEVSKAHQGYRKNSNTAKY